MLLKKLSWFKNPKAKRAPDTRKQALAQDDMREKIREALRREFGHGQI